MIAYLQDIDHITVHDLTDSDIIVSRSHAKEDELNGRISTNREGLEDNQVRILFDNFTISNTHLADPMESLSLWIKSYRLQIYVMEEVALP